MAKQLNVNLSFTADTQVAAQKLQQLQNQLNSILMNSGRGISSLGLNQELTEALGKTAELKVALEGALNPKTGTLDLGKFNESLRKSNTSITEYAQHLHSLGPAGQQAFSQLAASINQAEIPLRRSSTLLTEFATTLKNTARWQISSSILHGFMGTVQSAYGYAKDLNSSLNQIRIVTGQSTDQMAKFAEQANRAAKSLSTTTTDYTNASLIYYQQGLDDAQVKERTDLTIKMANVSGQSAEEVSNQLTAVWNNFAKGGENLEHFADVMVRLGADTASSSEEIATGLEKFAAIGDTIGLSFDNAAAALATVTATTRESAETVGTAFKTIFARIQGLKLGETLEDGTDLNKYSEALMAVGISIKNQNGELKDMDDILAEMGDKWTTLNRDQQVALAQTVAGVRQYNQLMALMDNFDFYEKNLESARNADGSLDKQADIYAESWEAASKRVRAAAEDIYDSLLKDDFFIKLTDGFAGFLNIIGDTIDGIGGMKGAIALLGVVITRVFAQDMSAALSRFAYNIKSFTAAGRKNLLEEQLRTKKETNQALRDFSNDGSAVGAVRADVNMAQANAQDALLVKSKSLLDLGRQLTDEEQKKAQIMLDQTRILGEQAVKAAENKEQSEKTADALERQMRNRLAASTGSDSAATTGFSKNIQDAKTLQTEYSIGIQMLERFKKQLTGASDGGKTFEKLKKYFKDFSAQVKESGMDLEKLDAIFDKIEGAKGAKQFINAFESELEELGASAQEAFDKIEIEIEQLEQAGQINPQQLESFRQKLEQLQQEFSQTGQFTEEQVAALRDLQIQLEATEGTIATFQGKIPTMADGIVAFGNVLSSVTMAFTSLKGLFDTWNNEDATFGEKLIATFTTLGMVIPIVTTAFKAQNLAQMATMSSAIASALGVTTLSSAEIMAGLSGTAAAGGTIAFSTALWTLLWPIGLVMLAIAALVAVVAGLVMLFEDIERGGVDQRLEDINTTIDELKTTISETKKETEELTEAIENIQTGYDSIAKMTAGTEEYAQAIEKTNEQVLQLLEKYPILYDYLTRDPNTNLLKIDQKGFDMVMQQQYAKEGAHQLALSAAQARKGELTIEKYNESWSQGGNNTARSGGNYANKLEQIGSYDQILQMTDAELSEAVKNLGGLAQEIKYRQTGSSNISGTASVDELPDGWQDEVRSDARVLRDAKAAQDTSAADLAYMQDAVFKGTGKSLRGKYQVTDADREKIQTDTAAEVKKFTDTDWNDHINYDSGDEEWGAIKKVVKSYGNDASYVAQRNGSMVINVDGDEKKLTEEQFTNRLTDAVYEERLNALIEENTKTVDQSLRDSGISQNVLDTMSNTEQANLDNIKYAVGATLKDADAGNRLFGGMVNDFAGMDTDQASASLNAMADAFNSTDWSQGTAAVDDYMARLDELGIKIDGQNKATLEEYAGKFRDIAKLQEGAASYAEDLNKSLEQQAAEVGMSETAMNAYVDQLKENEKYAKLSDKQLKEAAINQKKARNALDELAESWDSVKDAVKKNDVMSEDYEKGLAALRKAYSQLFDLDVSDEFLTNAENIELMEKALKGNQEAFEELSKLAAEDWLKNLDFSETAIDPNTVLNVEGFKSAISEIESLIQNGNWTPEIGINDDMINTLNEYVRAGKVTVDELNGYFGQVHGIEFETDVEYMKPEEAMSSSTASTNTSVTKNTITRSPMVDSDGNEISKGGTYTEEIVSTVSSLGDADVNENGEIGVPILKPKGDGSGGSNTHVAPKVDVKAGSNARANTMGGGKGGGGGGGGGKGSGSDPKPAKKDKPTKKKDTVERYKEINDKISKVADTMEDAAKAADHLWGANRIRQMERVRNLLHQELDLQKQYRDEIKANLKADKAELLAYMTTTGEDGLGDLGLQFNIDETTGFITNYTEVMTALHTKLNEYETHYNSLATADEQSAYAESTLEPFREKIDWIKDLISQYDDTNQLLTDKDNEIQDKMNEIRENAIEDIKYRIDIQVEINDNALEVLAYKISAIEDDFYKVAEASALTAQQIENGAKALELAYKPYNDILWEYNNGNNFITFDDVAVAAQEAIPEIIGALEQIRETDQSMLDYYGHALSKANEQFGKYSEFIEASASKMEHYRNMLSLIGKEMDFEKTGLILQGQFDIAQNSVKANKAYYEEIQNEYQALYDRWLKEKDTLDGYEKEMLERKLYDAKVAVTDAEEQYLSSLETTGELAQEILQNNLDKARKKLEENLVGSSLDDYMTSLDRLSKKQEEYLTTTNKMYETNKLIRQAQLEIDKTENNRAKQQYNDYVKYIEQLQESGKLSSYELSIAQAKYEVLQAQIALEEAQKAKDQVRLTRDSEGNYGYVYTANEDKIGEAEQALADAENALYNIGLEGAQDYQTKYAETMQEAVETFAQINEQYQSGQIASEEEYNNKMAEAKDYYYGLLKQYNELYYISHDLLVEESYENEADYLLQGIGNLEDFASYTGDYLSDVNGYFDEYDSNVSDITTVVDDNLQTLEDGTNDVVEESENLAETIEDELIPAIDKELLSVREITSAYALQRAELQKTIEKYEELLEKLQAVSEYGATGDHDYENIEDYSSEIEKWLSMGYEANDPIIQKLLEARWKKMGGEEIYHTDFKSEMDAEYAKNGESAWYQTLKAMRDFKVMKTDWSAYKEEHPDATWVDDVRAEKLNTNFAAEIEEYLKRPGTSEDDPYVQDRLAARAAKIKEQGLENEVLSNEELMDKIVRGIDSSKHEGKGGNGDDFEKAVGITTTEENTDTTSKAPTEQQIKDQGKQIYQQIMKGVYGNGWSNREEKAKQEFGDNYIPEAFELAKNVINGKASFDTGGYTGEWGPEGRLAMLHEKELVLNKQDTENFLSATGILREISQMLDNNALLASLGMINLRAMGVNTAADQVLQQEVTIHADFPNVTDHNEIELAIDNLINAASQHAYRT